MRIERFQQAGNRTRVKGLFGVDGVGRIGFHDGERVDEGLELSIKIVRGIQDNRGAQKDGRLF